MTMTYWLAKLRDAFLRNDYEMQTKAATALLPYEESGAVTNELLIELLQFL